MVCDDRQLTQAQRAAGLSQNRTGVLQAVRPYSGAPSLDGLVDYINRELQPAIKRQRDRLNDIFNQVRDNAPSGNPLQFYFSAATAAADPTTGYLRLNQATQDTATTIRVSQTNGRLQDVAPWLDVMAGGATTPLGTITLADTVNPARFLRFDLNTMVDQGAYWDLGVTIIESSHDNPFVPDGGVAIAFTPGVAAAGATVPLTAITPMAANTVLANPTASSAAPTAFPLSASTLLGRRATGNVVALTGVQQGELLRRETFVVDSTSSGSSATYTVAETTTQIVFKLSGALTIHGMTASTATFGKTIEVSFHDGFAGSVTFANESASAGSALQRIACPAGDSFVLLAGETCILTYFDSRWRITGVGKAARRRLPGDPIYDVMDAPFNAAGDGVTDDTAAINAAIAAANAVPGRIYLGTSHRVTAGLSPITSYAVEIVGRGMETNGTTVTCTTSPTAIFTFANGARFSGISNVRIVGASGTSGYGILFQQAFRCFAENVRITGVGNGVEIDRCNTTYIENVDVIDPLDDYGFHVHGLAPDFCHVTRFVRCQVGGSGTNYIGFAHGSYAHTVLYHECGVLQGRMGMHMFDDQGSAPTFVHAWQFSTDHPNDCGIQIDACEGAVWFHQVLVTSVQGGAPGIVTGADANNYQFHGGQIYGTGEHGFVLGGSGAKIQGMDITGVGFDGANTYDSINVAAGVTDFSIVGCSLGSVPGTSGGARYGINIGSGCNNYTVVGNIIRGFGTAAILNTPGRSSTRVVLNNVPDVTIASGSVWGLQVDATGPAVPVEITGLEQGENLRRETFTTITTTGTLTTLAITNITTQIVCKSTSALTVRGMTATSATFGKTIELSMHAGFAGSITLNNEDASAASALERIACPGNTNLVLLPGEVATITYFDSRWRVVAVAKAGVGVTDGDKGDVTVSSSGTVWTVDNTVITNAKLANVATATVKGRTTASTGSPEDLTLAASTSVTWNTATGGALSAERAALTGDVTASANSNATTIANSAVTLAKMANLAAGTVIGRAVDGGTGVPTALTGVQQGQNLRRETVVVDSTSSGTSATYTIANTTTQLQFKLAGALTINGMTASTATFGKLLAVSFDSGFAGSVTWNNESASAGAALERIRTPGAVALTISAGETALFEYFDSRWRCIAVGKSTILTDGDKGDITVSGSGATWTIDNNAVTTAKILDAAVTLAKQANLAQSTIIGRAEGGGTGVPQALTSTQVVAIIDGESPTWTGAHTFNGTSLTANVTTADVLLGAAVGGVGLFSGQATQNVTNGDLVLNSASGIAINASGTAVTSVGDGVVDLNATTLDIDVTTLQLDATNSSVIAVGSGTLTLAAGTAVVIASPLQADNLTATGPATFEERIRLDGTVKLFGVQSSATATLDNFVLGDSTNVLRLSGTNFLLSGMVPSPSAVGGQLVMICNIHDTEDATILCESTSSTLGYRFAGEGTSRKVRAGEAVFAWYDGTSEKWRLVGGLISVAS